MTITILPMAANHIKQIAAFEKDTPEPWDEAKLLPELENSHARFFAALSDGEAVGFIGAHFLFDEASILKISTAPAFRRQGIASGLLERLLAEAEREGIARVTLEVRESNLPARSLYERFGFAIIGKRPGFYENPQEDAIVMEKIIDK